MSDRERAKISIFCPHCGKKYNTNEVFVRGSLEDGFTQETYVCDECERPFKVDARLYFITSPDTDREELMEKD